MSEKLKNCLIEGQSVAYVKTLRLITDPYRPKKRDDFKFIHHRSVEVATGFRDLQIEDMVVKVDTGRNRTFLASNQGTKILDDT